jgi:hypothetical protein
MSPIMSKRNSIHARAHALQKGDGYFFTVYHQKRADADTR